MKMRRNRDDAGAAENRNGQKSEKRKKEGVEAREQNSPVVHFNYSQVVLSVSCAARCSSAAGGVKVTETVVCLHVWNTDGYAASSQSSGSMLTTLSRTQAHTHGHTVSHFSCSV